MTSTAIKTCGKQHTAQQSREIHLRSDPKQPRHLPVNPVRPRYRNRPVNWEKKIIDLTSSNLASSATIKTGPSLGSDHLLIIISLITTPAHDTWQPLTWIRNDNSLTNYNQHLSNTLREANFLGSQDPNKAYTTFMTNSENSLCFRKSTPSQTARPEPSRTWRNDDCNTVVKNARQAFKPWCKSLF